MNKTIPDILKKILKKKREEVTALYDAYGISFFEKKILSTKLSEYSFIEALQKNTSLAIIAEIKKASPSAGIISKDFDPLKIALAYQQGNADAISVLTDESFFKGSITYLTQIKKNIPLPLLRKDFIIDEIQILQAKACGADAFLLIATILSAEEIKRFSMLGTKLNMDVLVEVHNLEELQKIADLGCKIIGINNRNLRDFTVDLQTTVKLAEYIPEKTVLVGESGVKNAESARFLKRAGCKAILVGETLMRKGRSHCGEEIQKYQNV
ncbi:MAG: indole-3-glycerol phosphate synthase TrpC [Verrucomicrobiota bacterium]|nr:indole-3-glycerol phosphate synthase TrpC [Verrucomicrobiota bacterium]